LKTAIELTTGQGQSVKKLWAMPELMLIGANTVNGGAAPGVHEKSVSASTFVSMSNWHLHGPNFGSVQANHNKGFYNS